MIIFALSVVVIVAMVYINQAFKEANNGTGFVEQIRIDKKNWNNGKCHRCGYHWTLYKYDRKLGRVYVCTKCDDMTHVVTNVDKDYYPHRDPDYIDYDKMRGDK